MDKTKGMPHLILHGWDRDDKELLEELKKLGFDTEYFIESSDPKEDTVLITMEVDWCAWDYKLSPGEDVDPAVYPCSEDEVDPESKYYYKFLKDYIDCGTDKEKFLTLARKWESK